MSTKLHTRKGRWLHFDSQGRDEPHHPAVTAQFERRASDAQLRLADKITAFAGSMQFVYLHVLIFTAWMVLFEKNPWPTLTLAVSLEAIFLSTFVMIGQNRQSAFQQAKADSDYQNIDLLLEENTRLTRSIRDLTQEVRDLTKDVHTRIVEHG